MILVVGGAGYIGSHFAKLLRKKGLDHVVLDNLLTGHKEALGDSPFLHADMREPQEIFEAVAEVSPTLVVHFGALSLVGESVSAPDLYWQNNVSGTLHLCQAMRASGCQKLIFSSTAAVYGDPISDLIDEDHPKNPTSTYGDTKLAVETMLSNMDRAYGFKSVCLRYFNAAGADSEGELGEDHNPESHLIPRAILAILGKVPPLVIFGTDYPTPDGTCLRDYIHVEDLASAHLLAAEHLLHDGDSRRYNLGTGAGFSVREVVEMVGKVAGTPVPCTDGDRRAGDPARLVASSARVQKDWGWKPERSGLEDMVRDAWNWLSKNPDGY